MERKYTILAILLIILALGLVVLPKKNELKETDPKILLSAVVEKSRYLSVDQVTHRIIENDPTLLLIDLRNADQFKTFALPGSINLHADSLLSQTNLELFSQPGKDKVLYANADLMAEKAWLLCSRYSLNRIYIMKGGMNEWFNTIVKLKEVSGTPSTAELDLISFRKAAKQFLVGSGEPTNPAVTPAVRENIQVIRKPPKAASGGGC
jgi:sulfur-carrier protein adenylyltransferase/sulfurtransferase